MSEETLFWIDTLCAPLQSPATRKKSILHMHNIYAQATATIVLDEAIEKAECYTTTLEQLAALDMVDWTSRLWVLQEYVLSSQILLMYGGRLVNLIVILTNVIRNRYQDREQKKPCEMWDRKEEEGCCIERATASDYIHNQMSNQVTSRVT